MDDEPLLLSRLSEFIEQFVSKDSQDIWRKRILSLDKYACTHTRHVFEKCIRIDRATHNDPFFQEVSGDTVIAYTFSGVAFYGPVEIARDILFGFDCLYLFKHPGVAVFYSHEDEWWVCRESGSNHSLQARPP